MVLYIWSVCLLIDVGIVFSMLKFPPQKLKELLLEQKLATPEEFDQASQEATRMNQSVGEVLISKGLITADFLYNLIAQYLGVEQAHIAQRGVDRSVVALIDEKLAREREVIAFSRDADGTVNVAMQDPTDLPTIEFLEKRLGAPVRPFLAQADDLAKGFSFYGSQLNEDFKNLIQRSVQTSLQQKIGSERIEEAASQLPIVEIVNNLFSYAAALNASDVHLEIMEDALIVRFRIDGILYETMRIPKEVHQAITARIKLLSALKIDEHQKPQDGRFRYVTGQLMLDARVSVIPTLYGEKIVARLLPAAQRPLSLIELGMLERTAALIESNIKKSYGMILITGPTGSGKTTTLYSILNMLNRPQVNIVTVEDPIEYNIKYINQIQINPLAGITFASGLRSILRQDPNIIMVGEIRDEETAEIAVNAALTGHLLLSSLHTNDAPTAIPRLMDMKIPPFLVAAVLNVVIAQRLVRKICPNCIESFEPDANFIANLKAQMKAVGSEKVELSKTLYHGKGCQVCNGTGYKGRVGIYEAFELNEEMRREINKGALSLDNVIGIARKEGMETMFEDGLHKAMLGMTTIEEVLRVIRE